jgi:hypothetical protein
MPISRFDYVPGQPIVNTYVPLPYEEIVRNVRERQHEYDVNKTLEQGLLGQIAKIKARNEDIPALQQINKTYEDELNSIADSVMKDYGSSGYREKLNKLGQKLSSDLTSGDLFAIGTNYQGLQDWIKQKQDFKESPYKEYLDEKYTEIAPGGFYKGYKKSDGSFNIQQPGNIDKYIDRDKAADDLINGINSLGYADFKLTKDEFGNSYIVNEKGEHISADKIRSTFRNLFSNSEAAKQLVREADFRARMFGEDRNKIIQDSLKTLEDGVISKYTMSKYDKDLKIHDMPKWQAGLQQEMQAQLQAPMNQTEFTDNPLNSDLLKNFDENGIGKVFEFYMRGTNKLADDQSIARQEYEKSNGGTEMIGPGGMIGKIKSEGPYEMRTRDISDYMSEYKSNPTIKQLVDSRLSYDLANWQPSGSKRPNSSMPTIDNNYVKQVIKDYKEAVKNNANVSLEERLNTPSKSDYKSDIAINTLTDRFFRPITIGGEEMNAQQFLAKHSDKGKLKSVRASGTVSVNPFGEKFALAEPLMFEFENKDGGKSYVKVLSSVPSVKANQSAQLLQQVYNKVYSGTGGEVPIGNNSAIKIVSIPKDGKFQHKLQYIQNGVVEDLTDDFGNKVDTPEEFERYWHKNYILPQLQSEGLNYISNRNEKKI